MRQIKPTLFGIFLILLAGCAATEPSRFYTLMPMAGIDKEGLTEMSAQGISLGIGPIGLPDYLDRPQIVTSSTRNKINISEFNRWAGSLGDDLSRVFSENLSNLLSTDRIFLYPWRGGVPIDYQIEVEIIQFDGEIGGNVSLIARWTIFGGRDRKVLLIKKSSYTESTGESGYEAMVEAESRALGNLSREIATAIKDVSHRESDQ